MLHTLRMEIIKYDKFIFMVCMFAIFCLIKPAFCQENLTSPDSVSVTAETVDENGKQNRKTHTGRWQKIWGTKARDAILLGMWSFHLSGSGEYMGDGGSNEQNRLLGLQYYGLTAGTYINSHDDRAWFFGSAREVYSRQMTEFTRIDIGYRFGPLYGYGDDLPNIAGISLFGAGTFSFSWDRLGFDIMIIPVGVVTGGFRFNFD